VNMGISAAARLRTAHTRAAGLDHATGLQRWLRRFTITVGLLLFGGIAASFSTTVFLRIAQERPAYSAFLNHLGFILAGLIAAGLAVLVITKVQPAKRWLSRLIPLAFFASLLLVIMVKISPFGVTWLGATRGLHLGPITFQPSELLKITIVLYLAQLLCWWRLPQPTERQTLRGPEEDWGWLKGMWRLRGKRPEWPELPRRCMFILLGTMFFTVIQPDLGTTGIIFGASLLTFVLAGIDLRQLTVWLAGMVIAGTLAAVLFPGHFEYAAKRWQTYEASIFSPAPNEDGAAYQITQSRGALAAGGLWGKGYLKSEQKINRLPLSISDFVFPVMVEELGFVGGLLIIGLFAFMGFCAVKIAGYCRDPFHRTVIAALGLTVCMQALVNVGTTTGCLPLSGLTMPFFSYGGTSMVISLVACGLVYAFALVELNKLKADPASSRG
jgi:cell division protein FtsW (lipid II flippase)